MTRPSPFIACAALAVLASAPGCTDSSAATRAAPNSPPGVLEASGTATLDVTPDVVDLLMSLSVEQPSPKAAVAALNARRTDLVDALTTAGVANADLALGQLALSPTYRANGGIRGYSASITVTVTTAELDRIADLMESGAAVGVDTMYTNFRSTHLQELKSKVRADALAAAQRKADEMSQAVGTRLGRVIAIAETPAGGGWNYGELANVEGTWDRSSAPTLQPGTQPLTLTVKLSYQLL